MRITDLETPAVVIDRAKVEANLARAQAYADKHGLKLRPHIKTHKLPLFARRQVELGAIGITCQKLGEAEVMADGGLDDIFIPYNILGEAKLARLSSLHERIRVSVTADSATTVDGYAGHFTDPDHPLPVLIECDTGMGRCGVQSVEDVVVLARQISNAPGLRFEGLMTYPPRGKVQEVENWLRQAVDALEGEGLGVNVVSNGGTPDIYSIGDITTATEYRPGTYIYSDRMQVAFGHRQLDDCALTVLTQVISRPTEDRAVIDAGSKALAADTAPVPGYGHVVGYPDAVITSLSEEHGVIDLTRCSTKPEIGEKLHIIPNHVCVVSNLFDEVNLADGETITETVPVAARGRLS